MFDGCSLPLEYYYNYYNLIKSLQFKKKIKKKKKRHKYNLIQQQQYCPNKSPTRPHPTLSRLVCNYFKVQKWKIFG